MGLILIQTPSLDADSITTGKYRCLKSLFKVLFIHIHFILCFGNFQHTFISLILNILLKSLHLVMKRQTVSIPYYVYKCVSIHVYKCVSIHVYKCVSIHVYKCVSIHVQTIFSEWVTDCSLMPT
jgi:hypothetical protein